MLLLHTVVHSAPTGASLVDQKALLAWNVSRRHTRAVQERYKFRGQLPLLLHLCGCLEA